MRHTHPVLILTSLPIYVDDIRIKIILFHEFSGGAGLLYHWFYHEILSVNVPNSSSTISRFMVIITGAIILSYMVLHFGTKIHNETNEQKQAIKLSEKCGSNTFMIFGIQDTC